MPWQCWRWKTTSNCSKVQDMADNAKWYVAHTYYGYENAVKAAIEKSVVNRGMEDMVLKTEIPMETVTEVTETGVITYEDLDILAVLPLYAVICGRSIRNAENPAAEARRIKARMQELWT